MNKTVAGCVILVILMMASIGRASSAERSGTNMLQPNAELASRWWPEYRNLWAPAGWKSRFSRSDVLYNGTALARPQVHGAKTHAAAWAGDIKTGTSPLKTSGADSASAGHTQNLPEGGETLVENALRIEYLKLTSLLNEPAGRRVIEHNESDQACSVVAVMDVHLDLPAQLKAHAPLAGDPPVQPAPRMVVGEGEHPDNHTVIRVLNQYGIADIQFLAYPAGVRGGVNVNAGCVSGSEIAIVASPIADRATREIRVFSRWGGLIGAFEPAEVFQAPFAVAVGNFLPDVTGDQIVIMSRDAAPGNRAVGFYTGKGELLKTLPVPCDQEGAVVLSTRHCAGADELIVYLQAERKVWLLNDEKSLASPHTLDFAGEPSGVYESAFGSDLFWVTAPEPEISTVTVVSRAGEVGELDVGTRENRFWCTWRGEPEDKPEPLREGKYVKKAGFRHIRTDLASPARAEPDFTNTSPDYWAGPEFQKQVAPHVEAYETELPRLWEPCFTHRMHKRAFTRWAEATDEASGLPKYTMLTRNNNKVEYGEFGTVGFSCGTYAFGLPALDNLYIQPLRAFLRGLAVPFRKNPEHFVGLEPNHEHEIAVQAEGTKGDYNPKMIQGFFQYLVNLYGRDPDSLGRAMGLSFGEYFDAPRGLDRAEWDDYDEANPFFRNWIEYNRYVVNRRLAQTFREALLAGFPAEIIKSHQIPDSYAIGDLKAFSTVVSRYTPIDYAMNAGVGYGFTRYGVWYNKEYNVLQGAHSSGFDMVSIGEYQALTPDPDVAFAQLKHIFENGGYFVHCMGWPAKHDKGYNRSMDAAIRRLIALDTPKPGVTGGVGQVRAVSKGDAAYNVACVGTGPSRNGLLKSLNHDGSWEGTVYVVPFHAHVDVRPLSPVFSKPHPDQAQWRVGPLNGLDSGSQIELSFKARAKNGTTSMRFTVLRGNTELPGLAEAVEIGQDWKHCRYVLRVQLPVDDIVVVMSAGTPEIELSGLEVYRHTEKTTKLTKNILAGERHKGGVTFDILSPDYVPGKRADPPGR